MARARAAQAEAIEQERQAAGPNSGARMGGDVMYERVREGVQMQEQGKGKVQEQGKGSVNRSVNSQEELSAVGKSWMEAADEAEVAPRVPRAGKVRMSKEEAKQQRLAAARERRARQ